MNRSRSIALLVVFLSGAGLLADPKLQKFTSNEGRFTVLFPGKPKETHENKAAKVPENAILVGGNTLTAHLFQVDLPGHAYAVIYSELPGALVGGNAGANAPAMAQNMLKPIGESTQKGFGGKVVVDKEITLGKKEYPGREMQFDKDGTCLRIRMYLVESRLYQVTLVGPKAFVNSKDAGKYFDSFEVK